MNNQSAIENSKSPAGTLLQLEKHQITGMVAGSICPFCKESRIIFRSWRKDYLCGECFEVFEIIEGKVYYLGNQENLD